MQNKKLWLGALAACIAISGTLYLIRSGHHHVLKTPPPELTAEEILAERSKQSSKKLETPLGKAIVSRNWVQVDQLYQPQKDFLLLGEIIRGLYIDGSIKDFKPADEEELMTRVLSTFALMEPKNMHLSGMLTTQFERLPAPPHTSENFKLLKKWANDAKEEPLRRRLGVEKLVLHDTSPDPQAVKLFQNGFINGDTLGEGRNEWIQKIEEMRNVPVQNASLQLLAKDFKKIPPTSQPTALVVLSHHLNISGDQTKSLTLNFLASNDVAKFEAGLRSITPLLNENRLKDKEKDLVVKKLTNIPTPLQTPYTEGKSAQVLKLLGHT